jgi:hypothetical protein
MTDIVKQLRRAAKFKNTPERIKMLDEAADEIEKLRETIMVGNIRLMNIRDMQRASLRGDIGLSFFTGKKSVTEEDV